MVIFKIYFGVPLLLVIGRNVFKMFNFFHLELQYRPFNKVRHSI